MTHLPTSSADVTPPGPANIVDAVFQAVGAASMCWIGGTGAAVFDETRAIKVAEGLLAFIREHDGALWPAGEASR